MIYVNQKDGSDDTGTGTAEAPYQTLVQAILKHGQSSTFSLRADSSTDYSAPSPTALKRAKKDAEIRERKTKKAEEKEAREQENKATERERAEKKIEESKMVILQEDPSLPKSTKVGWWNICSLETY
jgi:asparaginyl-tRNA synthetase